MCVYLSAQEGAAATTLLHGTNKQPTTTTTTTTSSSSSTTRKRPMRGRKYYSNYSSYRYYFDSIKRTISDLMMLIYCRDCLCYGYNGSTHEPQSPSLAASLSGGLSYGSFGYTSGRRSSRLRGSNRRRNVVLDKQQQFAVCCTSTDEEDAAQLRREQHEEIELNLFIYQLPQRANTATTNLQRTRRQQQQQQPELSYRQTVTLRRDVGTDTRSLVKYDLDPQSGHLSERLSITEVTTPPPSPPSFGPLETSESDNKSAPEEVHKSAALSLEAGSEKPKLNLAISSKNQNQKQQQNQNKQQQPDIKQQLQLLDRRKDISTCVCCGTQPKNGRESFMVMISYHHAEASDYAMRLKEALEQLDLSVYLDVHEIRKGSDWQDSLNEAILYCRAFVPLITPSYGKTLWTSRELKLADVMHKLIIPVNFGQRWPPPSLAIQFATLQYIFWLATDHSQPNVAPLLRPFSRSSPIEGGSAQAGEWPDWPIECVRLVAKQIKQSVDNDFCSLPRAARLDDHLAGVLRIEQQLKLQQFSDSGYDSSCSIKQLSLGVDKEDSSSSSSSFEELASLAEDCDCSESTTTTTGPRSLSSSSGSCPNSNSSDDRLKSFRLAPPTAKAAAPKETPTPELILTRQQQKQKQPQQQEKKGLKNRAAKAFKKVRRRLGVGPKVAKQQQQPI